MAYDGGESLRGPARDGVRDGVRAVRPETSFRVS